MANQTPPAAAASAAPASPAPGNTEDRVAAQRLQDLTEQASKAAAETQTAKAEAAAAKGDLERANTEVVALRAQVERLTAQNQQLAEASQVRDGVPTLPVDLPRGAFQLVESVTIASLGDDGKPVRANAKRGDVLLVGKKDEALADLQGRIGSVARVYAVSAATVEELRTLKHLR